MVLGVATVAPGAVSEATTSAAVGVGAAAVGVGAAVAAVAAAVAASRRIHDPHHFPAPADKRRMSRPWNSGSPQNYR